MEYPDLQSLRTKGARGFAREHHRPRGGVGKIIKGEPLVAMVTVDLGFHLADIGLTRIGDPLFSRKCVSSFSVRSPTIALFQSSLL